ncbi:MAG: ATP-binding protein [Bacteroidales bacterium]|nr:ATP-binding protein [Bacteroidales bacterium]
MSKYTFKLSNYHAIKDADITLDGITVLSGENGSGKSTISRWLYYLLKGVTEHEKYVEKDSEYAIRRILNKIRRTSTLSKGDDYFTFSRSMDFLPEIENIFDFEKDYFEIVNKYIKLLSNYFAETNSRNNLARLASSYNIEVENDDKYPSVLNKIAELLHNEYENIVKNNILQKNSRSLRTLTETISHFANDGDRWPKDIGLSEDRVNLLTKKEFKTPLSITKAIYFGTQGLMNSFDNEEGIYEFITNKYDDMPVSGRLIQRRIQQIINGTITFDKEDSTLFDRRELHYHREDGLDIPLKEAATGLISFAVLGRLLEMGYLNPTTLLIVDEPEAHLHPQWIVEYARTIVQINRRIGTKILISTHNPDMVSAIQSIARKENVLNTTNFYLAEKIADNDSHYIYKYLGNEIGEIFESFNIALSRIQIYGEQN